VFSRSCVLSILTGSWSVCVVVQVIRFRWSWSYPFIDTFEKIEVLSCIFSILTGRGSVFDWCCFYYFVWNILVVLLARIFCFRFVNIGFVSDIFLCCVCVCVFVCVWMYTHVHTQTVCGVFGHVPRCRDVNAYIWHIHVCDMTHSYVWHSSLLCDMNHWCDITRSNCMWGTRTCA